MAWIFNRFNKNTSYFSILPKGVLLGSMIVLAIATVGCQKKDKPSDTKEETQEETTDAENVEDTEGIEDTEVIEDTEDTEDTENTEDTDTNVGEFQLDEESDVDDTVRQVITDKDSTPALGDSSMLVLDDSTVVLDEVTDSTESQPSDPSNKCHELESGIPLDPAAYDYDVIDNPALTFEELPIFSFKISPTLCHLKQSLTQNSSINGAVDSFFANDVDNATQDLLQIGLLLRQIIEYDLEDVRADYAVYKISAFTAFVENRIESDRASKRNNNHMLGLSTAAVFGIGFGSSAGFKMLNRLKDSKIIERVFSKKTSLALSKTASKWQEASSVNRFIIASLATVPGFYSGYSLVGPMVFSSGEFEQLADQELLKVFREGKTVQELIEILNKMNTTTSN